MHFHHIVLLFLYCYSSQILYFQQFLNSFYNLFTCLLINNSIFWYLLSNTLYLRHLSLCFYLSIWANFCILLTLWPHDNTSWYCIFSKMQQWIVSIADFCNRSFILNGIPKMGGYNGTIDHRYTVIAPHLSFYRNSADADYIVDLYCDDYWA